MGHSHDHSHSHSHRTENITFAFFLNLFFAVLELAGGMYTNSVSILSDALHDFGDSLSLGTAWYFQKKAQKKRDNIYTYGYRRFSLLGAFINSTVLVTGSVFIIKEAIERISTPEQPDAKGMLVLAIIGIAVNTFAMLRLKSGSSINERVLSLHFLEDVLGWAAVLIGAIVMTFADIPILDPLLSIGIAGFILFNVYRNIKDASQIILQGIPAEISVAEVEKAVLSFRRVKSVHDLHIWTLDGEYNILTLHAVVAQGTDIITIEQLKHDLKENLKRLHIQHATIEIEMEGNACDMPEH